MMEQIIVKEKPKTMEELLELIKKEKAFQPKNPKPPGEEDIEDDESIHSNDCKE